jgi:4-hydroxybenzoate polyprenyltransferase
MKFLLYSHLYLGVCAASMTLANILIGIGFVDSLSYMYLFFVFFSVLVVYNTKGALAISSSTLPTSEKLIWAYKHRYVVLGTLGFSGLMSAVLLVQLPVYLYSIIIPLSILSLLYSLSFNIGTVTIAIRNIPYLKTFLVAAVWTVIVFVIPLKLISVNPIEQWNRLMNEFLFLFSLAILFDLKDVEKDKLGNVKTFPILLGIEYTKYLSMGIMVIRLLFVPYNTPLFYVELLLSLMIIFSTHFFLEKNRNEKFYMLNLDGWMIVKAVVTISFLI